MNKRFAPLKEIIADTIQQGIDTNTLDIGALVRRMEIEFARLGYREKTRHTLTQILIVRLDGVGDFILTSSAIRTIRENGDSL